MKITLLDRIKNAVRAFKGQPVGSLTFGVDIKRCDKCECKSDPGIRDNLLVTAGARAAYMDCANSIDIPGGLEGEDKLAKNITDLVDIYGKCDLDVNFDEYIEAMLLAMYRKKSPQELYETYKYEWCKARSYDLEAMDESVGINGECYASFDEWYANEYAGLKEV